VQRIFDHGYPQWTVDPVRRRGGVRLRLLAVAPLAVMLVSLAAMVLGGNSGVAAAADRQGLPVRVPAQATDSPEPGDTPDPSGSALGTATATATAVPSGAVTAGGGGTAGPGATFLLLLVTTGILATSGVVLIRRRRAMHE
jgi:hypothetical protein